MENKPLEPQADDNHRYNGNSGSDPANAPGTGKIDVIIPADLPEIGTGAARALLHLIVEAHRKRTTNDNQSAEDT